MHFFLISVREVFLCAGWRVKRLIYEKEILYIVIILTFHFTPEFIRASIWYVDNRQNLIDFVGLLLFFRRMNNIEFFNLPSPYLKSVTPLSPKLE